MSDCPQAKACYHAWLKAETLQLLKRLGYHDEADRLARKWG